MSDQENKTNHFIRTAETLNKLLPSATLLKGIAIGILLPIIGYLISSLDSSLVIAKYVLAFLVAIVIVFYLGILFGQSLYNKALDDVKNNWEENLNTSKEASKNLVQKLLELKNKESVPPQEAVSQVSSKLKPFLPLAKKITVLGVAFVSRVWAFSSLMGVLAFAISLAVCIATFMQVKYLREQNNLFSEQNKKVKEQTELMKSQNELLKSQNGFFELQLGQIDTQNLYIQKQIAQADIQNKLVQQQNIKIEHQNKRLDQQTNLQEAERRSSLVFLFSNIMDAIDSELKDSLNKKDTLSKQLIGRIIALSTRLSPYRYLTEGDTLISHPLSPERGQLLVNLVESDLDSNTYKKIWFLKGFGGKN